MATTSGAGQCFCFSVRSGHGTLALFDLQVQLAHTVEARVRLDGLIWIDANRCEAAQEDAEHDPGLQPRQRRPQAEVDAFAEGEMRIRVAVDDKLVRTIEPSFVMVGG